MMQQKRTLLGQGHATPTLERLEDRTVPSASTTLPDYLVWQESVVAVTVDSVILSGFAQLASTAVTDSSGLFVPTLLGTSSTGAQQSFISLAANSGLVSADSSAASSPTDSTSVPQTDSIPSSPDSPAAGNNPNSTGGSSGNKGNALQRVVGHLVDQVSDLALSGLASLRPRGASDALEDTVSAVSAVRSDLGPPSRSQDTLLGAQALGVLPSLSLQASASVGGNLAPTASGATGVTGLTGRSGPAPMLAGGDGGAPSGNSRSAAGTIGFDVRSLSSSGLDIVPVPVRGDEGESTAAVASSDETFVDGDAVMSSTATESGRDIRLKRFLLGVDAAPPADNAATGSGEGFSQSGDPATDLDLLDAILLALWDDQLSNTAG